MTREIKRLDMVEGVFAAREGDAARELNRFQALLQEAQEQLASLQKYRNRYTQELRRNATTDLNRLQNEREFVRRLDDAIRQQEAVVDRAQRDCDALAERYRLSRQKTKAVGKVCSHRRRVQRADGERREQKELDERSNALRKP